MAKIKVGWKFHKVKKQNGKEIGCRKMAKQKFEPDELKLLKVLQELGHSN